LTIICTHCAQHVICDDQWAGQQIQCPACQKDLIVPQSEPAVPPPQPATAIGQPSPSSRHRLSPGVTQVTRRQAPPISSQRKGVAPRRAKSANLAGYIVLVVGLAVAGWAAYTYLPGLISQVHEAGNSKAPATPASSTSSGGGGGAGPLGEANAAMDISDSLDGASAPSRPRVDAAKRLITGQPVPPATNTPPKSPKPR